ncbi:RNA polymerase sigma factor [Planobispora siamensis]|uniref:RNA polymerase sigma24 factor n=1 Tax=Planobispora siamensis TaxID=936338 RepID=A0A8J3SAS8_9ACTN|nr:sigma-70 family RNA polymerase sigma factor [Planobispora siamensis]GIH89820.1 RNA polymerase sigma24 factor [Planobispora siamensis]
MVVFAGGTLPPDDVVVAALRAGDEAMFATLLDAWSRGMLRLARSYVSTGESAQEVVQDAWLAVIEGIDGFEGRSSVKTWVHRILINTAKKRSAREERAVPWSSVFERGEGAAAGLSGSVDGVELPPAFWKRFSPLRPTPEDEALASEVREQIAEALAGLPARQRVVITLRDVEGCTSEEVCEILDISTANQRVLLHRARSWVRERMKAYLETVGRPD